jgi:cytochrome b6
VGTEIAGGIPWMGKYILYVMRGGENITGTTLSRFYTLHVIVLPWVAAVFLGTHFLMIRRQGISGPL